MPNQTEYDKLVQAEVTRIQQQESEKRFLYDRSVGGENVPRPTREYIEKSVGPLKSEQQIRLEAQENVRKQLEAERAEQRRRQDVERSMREQNQRVKEQQHQDQTNSLADRLRQQREQRGPDKGRER